MTADSERPDEITATLIATATVVLLLGGSIFASASDWNLYSQVGLGVIVAGSFLAALAIRPKSLSFESRLVKLPLYLGFLALAVAAGLWIFSSQDPNPAMRLALSALLVVGLALMIWVPKVGIVVLVFVASSAIAYGLYFSHEPSSFQPASTCSNTSFSSASTVPTPGEPTPAPIVVGINYPGVMDPNSSSAVVLSLLAAPIATRTPTPHPAARRTHKPTATPQLSVPSTPCPTPQRTPNAAQAVQAPPIAVGTPGKDLRAAFGKHYDDLSAIPGLHAVQFKSVPLNTAGESAMEQQTRWGWTVTPKNSGQQVILVEIDGIWSCVPHLHCEQKVIRRRIWESALAVKVNAPSAFAPGQIVFTLLPASIPALITAVASILAVRWKKGGEGRPRRGVSASAPP